MENKRIITIILILFGLSSIIISASNLLSADKENIYKKNNIQASHTSHTYPLKKFANDNNYTLIKVNGASMQPTLFSGNYVIIENTTHFREGDIVRYKSNNSTVIHRVKAKYEDYYYAQGDNNVYEEKVYYNQTLGVVIAVLY